jgi:Domain of unknown function (DUF6471)
MVNADLGAAQAAKIFLSLVRAGTVKAVSFLMVKRLKKHGLKETEAGITMKLKRGTFSATFFLVCLAAFELEGVVLEEI